MWWLTVYYVPGEEIWKKLEYLRDQRKKMDKKAKDGKKIPQPSLWWYKMAGFLVKDASPTSTTFNPDVSRVTYRTAWRLDLQEPNNAECSFTYLGMLRSRAWSGKNKCRYGYAAFLPFKLALFWPLIEANISDQLPKSHKVARKAYRYDFSQKRSASMVSRQPRKCQCAIPVHTISLRALLRLMVDLLIRNFFIKLTFMNNRLVSLLVRVETFGQIPKNLLKTRPKHPPQT